MPVHWHSDAWLQKYFLPGLRQNVSAAALFLSAEIKAEISQAGTLKYRPLLKPGKGFAKQAKWLRNVTHSLPGNAPFKQTGGLRASESWELVGPNRVIGRVGSPLPLAVWLELGTRHMAARPHMAPMLEKHKATIGALVCRKIAPGTLAAPVPASGRGSKAGALNLQARRVVASGVLVVHNPL